MYWRGASGARAEVQDQVKHGIDIVNDGEFGKGGFSNYARTRLSGLEQRPAESRPAARSITGRDSVEFKEFFDIGAGGFGRPHAAGAGGGGGNQAVFCVGPVSYIGQSDINLDIQNFKAALRGVEVQEAFMPAIAPGTIEHWLWATLSERRGLPLRGRVMRRSWVIVDAGPCKSTIPTCRTPGRFTPR
jgi:5-methyltetrahydropteroyltriglutamate--homocysteine methyltransferase